MKVLAIETSCDETAVALLNVGPSGFKLEKNIVSSQIAIHSKYGGVVPEVAARKHLETLLSLLSKTIGLKKLKTVDLLAVTSGPGLITSLMIGTETAKTLAMTLDKPLMGVNHLEGHIYSNWLSHKELFKSDKKIFPALVLIVSGGHTELVLMKGHGQYKLLGQTLDDAAGEAFDKVAKILNLGYPGGPIISKLAEGGNSRAMNFPRPMSQSKDLNFSYAGLKTAVLYYLQKQKKVSKKELPDIAASFQAAAIDVLTIKTAKAIKNFKPKSIVLAGGVSANNELRKSFVKLSKEYGLPVFYPELKLTGDNAAMIAVAAYYHRHDKGLAKGWQNVRVNPQWRLVR